MLYVLRQRCFGSPALSLIHQVYLGGRRKKEEDGGGRRRVNMCYSSRIYKCITGVYNTQYKQCIQHTVHTQSHTQSSSTYVASPVPVLHSHSPWFSALHSVGVVGFSVTAPPVGLSPPPPPPPPAGGLPPPPPGAAPHVAEDIAVIAAVNVQLESVQAFLTGLPWPVLVSTSCLHASKAAGPSFTGVVLPHWKVKHPPVVVGAGRSGA